ncbi:hypothetical protein XELAEV_18001961mg [Xenopus laevis]|uniref:Uncharacterized protein n=1 Tax=Xenopus laevis TaxID=8355 RepID=A0A974BP09_XENLA|nr:hypothetical protein XELAEV_18001961mg [Xenopus laevis]
MNEIITRHRRVIEDRKRVKFQCDAEDYRIGSVYQWKNTDREGVTYSQRHYAKAPAGNAYRRDRGESAHQVTRDFGTEREREERWQRSGQRYGKYRKPRVVFTEGNSSDYTTSASSSSSSNFLDLRPPEPPRPGGDTADAMGNRQPQDREPRYNYNLQERRQLPYRSAKKDKDKNKRR